MKQNGRESSLLYSRLKNKFWGLGVFFSLPEISIFLTVTYVKTSQLYFKKNSYQSWDYLIKDKLKRADTLLQGAKFQMQIKRSWSEIKVQVGILAQWFHSTWRRKTTRPHFQKRTLSTTTWLLLTSVFTPWLKHISRYHGKNEFKIFPFLFMKGDAQAPFFPIYII